MVIGDWQLAAGFRLLNANIYLSANFSPSTICKLLFARDHRLIASSQLLIARRHSTSESA
jgi:hypothetical protein